MEPISANLATVSGRIGAAARAAGRPADAVTLIAVSKTQPADSVRAALAAGFYPFVLADLVKLVVAASVMPALWRQHERVP